MRLSIVSLALWLAGSLPAFGQAWIVPNDDRHVLHSTTSGSTVVHEPAASLIEFDETGRVVDEPSRKAASIQLDAFAAVTPTGLDVRLGVGLVLRKTDRLRLVAGVANGGLMTGVAYRFVPVLDLSVGVGGLWVMRDGDVLPIVYTSIAHW